MRSWLRCSAVVLALAGCGGDDDAQPVATPAPVVPSPVAVDTPSSAPYVAPVRRPAADAFAAKSDARQAVSEMEARYSQTQDYVTDPSVYGPTFPASVTINAADGSGYTVTAAAADGHRFTIARTGAGQFQRTCAPVDAFCPEGTW